MKNHLLNRLAITLLLSAAFASITVRGANYYFSTSDGDDSRSSAQAQNPGTPWKTLSKLNSFFASLKPGDSVLFKRGDIFYGTFTITVSGTSLAPIVLSAYGSGNKPVISGLTTVSGWTSLGGGIYESSFIPNAGANLNLILLAGSIQQMGRYPNADAGNSGYLSYQVHTGQTSITSNQISGIPDFTGGEVVIRPQRDILDRCIITGQTSTTVSYTKVSSFVPVNGYGFFFQNHINTLDQLGEWYYNPKTKKLDVFFGTTDPTSYNIQASTVDTLVKAQSRTNITLNNIQFTGSNIRAIYLLGGSKINITNCDVLNNGQDGIYTQGATFLKIDNCLIKWCNDVGIFLNSRETTTANTITNCIITNIATHAGMGLSGSSSYQGMTVQGGKNLVANNIVDSTGYDGIKFAFGDSTTIRNNYVNHFCFIKNDGGGIYTWNNVRDKNNNVTAITYYGNKIIGNIVVNAGNADNGTIYSETNVDHPIYGSHGIYCDGNSENLEVSGNTVANNGKGIFLHDNRNMIVKNNTVFNNRERQLEALYDDSTLAPVRNLNIKNNLFFSKQLTQETGGFMSLYTNDLQNFGAFDSNYYAQSFDKVNLIFARYLKNGLNNTQKFDIEGWKLAYADDQHSKPAATTLTEYTLNNLLSANRYSNGTYDLKTMGTVGYNKGGTYVASWDNSGKLDGGCYKLSYKATSTVSTTTTLAINIGAVSSSKNYILRYSLLGTKNNGTIGIYLRSKTSYLALTPTKYYTFGTNRIDNEVLFSFPVTESGAQLIFQFNDKDSTIYLDNVQLYEADVTITNPDNYLRFEYNPTNNPKTITLDASYVDVTNTVYSGDITLAPYTSIILLQQSATSLVSSRLTSNALSNSSSKLIEAGKTQLKLLAFPNPTPSEFNLLIHNGNNESAEIDVFDMSGKIVYHNTGSVTQKYSFGKSFLPGVYILKVTQGKNVQTIKLIK